MVPGWWRNQDEDGVVRTSVRYAHEGGAGWTVIARQEGRGRGAFRTLNMFGDFKEHISNNIVYLKIYNDIKV